jgi:hypothetical protein
LPSVTITGRNVNRNVELDDSSADNAIETMLKTINNPLMMKKSKIFIFRRGYWYALGACLLISFLNGFKYSVFLKNNPGSLEVKKGLLSSAILFIISVTVAMLIVRSYYNVKDKTMEHRKW